ncbi:MAG: hypothetical protein WC455_18100 [Dehalococcoidia bacterium]|jgi:hypothetical protein
MTHLHDYVCRCHDAGCPQHETCLRWLDRKGGQSATHNPSMFPYEIPLGSPCPFRIAVEPSTTQETP